MQDFQHDASGDTAAGSRFEAPGAPQRRRRGRPELVSRHQVLELIRGLAALDDGLFRVHQTNPDLYARARRQFGSWSAALDAAGVDYRAVMDRSRRRSIDTRRARRGAR